MRSWRSTNEGKCAHVDRRDHPPPLFIRRPKSRNKGGEQVAFAQNPTAPRRRAPTGCGPGRCSDPTDTKDAADARSSSPGRPRRRYIQLVARPTAGATCRPVRASRPRQCPNSRRRRCCSRKEGDRQRQPQRRPCPRARMLAIRFAAIRVPGDRHRGGPADEPRAALNVVERASCQPSPTCPQGRLRRPAARKDVSSARRAGAEGSLPGAVDLVESLGAGDSFIPCAWTAARAADPPRQSAAPAAPRRQGRRLRRHDQRPPLRRARPPRSLGMNAACTAP